MKRWWHELKLVIVEEICYRMMSWVAHHFPDEYGRLMWAHAVQAIMNNRGRNDYSLVAIGPTEMLVQLESQYQAAVALLRMRFVQHYCDERSWNVSTLTDRQLAEIQSQRGWTHPSLMEIKL